MRISKFILLLITLTLITIFSCSNNENEPTPNSDINFTAIAYGMPFESGGFYVAAALSEDEIGFYAISIEAYDYVNENTGEGRGITISLAGHDFDNLQAGTEFTELDISTGEGAIGTYLDFKDFSEFVGGTSFEEEGSAYVKITSLDKSNQLISGEFTFDIYDGRCYWRPL